MTNRSFLFTCKGKKYIMRIPGEGTDQLINRRRGGSLSLLMESIFAMILRISIRKMVIKSRNFWKAQEYATH